MAEPAPTALGDFFAKKSKKKIKGSNLNNASTDTKADPKKTKPKDTEEEGWEDEQVVAATMTKVDVVGKLTREEEAKPEEDSSAPAWGSLKSKGDTSRDARDERKFPTLKKAYQSSSINVDDGNDGNINIKTSKNIFAELANADDDDDDTSRRPKEIKPAMVTKKKGEREKVAIQREVDKYTPAPGKKGASGRGGGDGSDSDEDDDDGDGEPSSPEPVRSGKESKPREEKRKKEDKREPPKAKEPVAAEGDDAAEEDTKIVCDTEAARAKYEGRRKLPPQELPRSELEEEKPKAKPKVGGGKPGKKKVFMEEEDFDKKLAYLPDDF